MNAKSKDDRLMTGRESHEDAHEASLRPQALKDFVGQTQVCANLKVFVQAARIRS